MAQVKFALGYDTERPMHQFAEGKEGRVAREKQLTLIATMRDVFAREGVPRTHFILGDYLNRCLETHTKEGLRNLYTPEDPLVDIQSHSYSHPTVKIIPDRPDRIPITADKFEADLKKANKTLEEVLGVTPTGLRIPLGYERDLGDAPDVARAIANAGLEYVSSHLRSPGNLCADLSHNGQPHFYERIEGAENLLEIPTAGWQDVVFAPEGNKRFVAPKGLSFPASHMVGHYTALFDLAAVMAREIPGGTVYVTTSMHPWAVADYDPNLVLHKQIFDNARNRGVEIVHYSQINSEIRAKRE